MNSNKVCASMVAVTMLAASPLVSADGADNDNSLMSTEDFSYQVGVVVMNGAQYMGSNSSETKVRPMFNITYHINDEEKLAANFRGLTYSNKLDNKDKVSLSLQYLGERQASDASALAGMGDLDSGLVLTPEYTWNLKNVAFTSGLSTSLSGDYGTTMDLSASVRNRLGAQWVLTSGLNISFADDTHMQNYYGVNASQSGTSGYQQYDASSGLKSYGANASLMYRITPQTSARFNLNHTILSGDAAASPLTQQTSGTSTSVGLVYRF
jgi:outer membrane scaffolding protein for murein synthesis (MipA/OmpV family)